MSSRNMVGYQIFKPEEVPTDWECLPLGARIKLRYGRALGEEDRAKGAFPVYGSNGKVGTHDVACVAGPGILVGRKGSIGIVHFSQGDFWPIDTVFYVEKQKQDDWLFLNHLLSFLKFERLNAATGVPGLPRGDALTLRGVFPRPTEQITIARILNAADEAITRAQTALERAQTLKRGVLQMLLSCGVDETSHIRNPHTQPELFHKTRAGLLPKAWNVSNVGKEFSVGTGFTLGEHRRPQSNARRYLRVANVKRDFISLDDVSELEAREEEFRARTLEVDDLLVVEGHANPLQIGRCARVTPEAAGLTFQNHLFRLRSRGISPRFATLWANGRYAQSYWMARCATSSGLNTINQRLLKAMPVVVPEPGEQLKIVALSEAAQKNIEAVQHQLQLLQNLKRGLMQDLLTGRVRVPISELDG